ncbi:hypothetical protein P7C73_g3879, partial [Tremellales sp. Uapishka_1]
MSPSRIPRRGQSASPGPMEVRSPNSALRSNPSSPAVTTASAFRQNPFTSRLNGTSPLQPTPKLAQPKRRPKPPPSPEFEEIPLHSPQSQTQSQSHFPPRQPGYPPQRSCLRQPSTPSLVRRDEPKARARAASAAEISRPAPPAIPSQPLPTSLFYMTPKETSVPPHIKIRLKLIHQLGVVLGLDAAGISRKIDIPGLLARVDAAYDRGHLGVVGENAETVTSILPLPRGSSEASASKDGGGKKAESKGSSGVIGIIRRFGRKPVDTEVETTPVLFGSTSPREGPAFGVPLNDAPVASWCTSLIGGQRHELPLIVFTVVEEIYRRGMSQPGIFRLAGDGNRISHLTKIFNLPPLYGDSLSIAHEPVHNLTGLVKRYIRDLPEPILDESLFRAFLAFCAEPEPGVPLATRITAAQIILKLLPPLHFSLFVYLLAFLGQLPLFSENRLNVESISIIFGPAMCAARGKGISGLGPSSQRGVEHDPDEVSNLVNQSQVTLGWLLRHWSSISEKVLDPAFEIDTVGHTDLATETPLPDSRLLSPIDLRPVNLSAKASIPIMDPVPVPLSSPMTETGTSSTASLASDKTAFSETVDIGCAPGMFARAMSSMSISSDARERDRDRDRDSVFDEKTKAPKRSASFTSLSGLMKKGQGVWMAKMDPKSVNLAAVKALSDERDQAPKPPAVNPQITNVLGSLHDLLVSKDKQIERDARELALLRHTLLEMDERLSRSSSPRSHILSSPTTPAITITATPSTSALVNAAAAKDRDISELQSQLSTTVAGLETARVQSRNQQDRILDLEAKLARAESDKKMEMGKLEVALALEQAKVQGIMDERDLAKERLEKVKTTLFSVA